MTIAIEQDVSVSGPAPEQESNPHLTENQPPHDGVCANPRCRKGPNGTRGNVKSPRAKYCCPYCRVDVLSGRVKSGQRWSGQNRPTDVARDMVLLSHLLLIRQVRFRSPAPWSAFQDVTVV